MNPGAPFAEIVGIEEMARGVAAWRALAAGAAEPNVFAEPEFLIPALRYLPPKRIVIARVWRDAGKSDLIGLAAFRLPRFGFGLARIWRGEQAGLGAAVFASDAVEPALSAIVTLLRERWRGVAGLAFPILESNGPTADALRGLSAAADLRLVETAPRQRAALMIDGFASFEAGLDRKRRKEWGRQMRRLSERGVKQADVLGGEGIEAFLQLEASGWKGKRGTALNAEPSRLAFARQTLAGFAALGRLQVHRLALDGIPVAMGLLLTAGTKGFYWKTAYNESWAEYSPGVQLTLQLSRTLSVSPTVKVLDSCALVEHPMIDRVWPGRLELAEYAIAVDPQVGERLAAWLVIHRHASAAREAVKRRVYAVLGRKRS